MLTQQPHLQATKHLTAGLLQHASSAGIEIRAIDPERPVAEQGPFDLILQKCRDAGLRLQTPPSTCPPLSARLKNNLTMLLNLSRALKHQAAPWICCQRAVAMTRRMETATQELHRARACYKDVRPSRRRSCIAKQAEHVGSVS